MELSIYTKSGNPVNPGTIKKPLGNHTVLFKHDSIAGYKRFITESRKKVAGTENKELMDKARAHSGGDRWVGGTIEECERLTSFKDPDTMKSLYHKVKDRVSSIQMQNVRSNVHLNDFHGEFCPDAFDSGSQDYLATLQDKRDLKQHVTVVLSMGYNSKIQPQQAIYNSLAGVVFCDLLQTAGYSVDIWVADAVQHHIISNNTQLTLIKAKQGSNYLDPDSLAILASDSRLFRHWHFQHNIIAEDCMGSPADSGLGRSLGIMKTEQTLRDVVGLDFDFIFGKCFSFNDTVQQVVEALRQVEEMNKAITG